MRKIRHLILTKFSENIEITSWKARACGIFARVGDVSEIERVRFQIQNQRVRKYHTKCFPCCNLFILYILRLKWCIVIPHRGRSFVIISFVNKHWNSFRWSVCNRKSLRLNCLPFGIFQIFCSICICEKLNVSPLRMTMFAADSQSKVNLKFEINLFRIKCLLLSWS